MSDAMARAINCLTSKDHTERLEGLRLVSSQAYTLSDLLEAQLGILLESLTVSGGRHVEPGACGGLGWAGEEG